MSDERPVRLQISTCAAKQSNVNKVCIVHDETLHTDSVTVGSLSSHSFEQIRNAVSVRRRHSVGSHLNIICEQVPTTFVPDIHGVHWECYRRFTNVSESSADSSANGTDGCDVLVESTRRSTRCPLKSPSILFSKDKCIFCSTCRKRKSKCQYETLTQCMSKSGEEAIKKCALQKSDFHILGMVDNIDLVAREAMYHKTCYKAYLRGNVADQKQTSIRSAIASDAATSEDVEGDDINYASHLSPHDIKQTKCDAFAAVCQYVQENIIDNGCVERMVMLRERYLLHIQEHSPTCFDPDYRTSLLKKKLIDHFGDRLRFFHPANNRGDLVYSANLELGDAVGAAFEAMSSESRILREAAFILRRDICNAAKNSSFTEWPPSVEFLTSGVVSTPSSLETFLTLLFTGKGGKCSDRVTRLRQSVGEDICSAATTARWKMPKHLLLGVSVHHLTGSAELVTLLNRFGHCANYSAVMEVETAMADSIVSLDSVLPANIHVHSNKFSHTVWDNFDVIEETPSGSGTTHSTHGIVIQEQYNDVVDDRPSRVSSDVIPSKKRSFTYTPVPLALSFSKKHVEPSSVTLTAVPASTMAKSGELPMLFEWIWIMCRHLFMRCASNALTSTYLLYLELFSGIGKS